MKVKVVENEGVRSVEVETFDENCDFCSVHGLYQACSYSTGDSEAFFFAEVCNVNIRLYPDKDLL